MSYSALRIVPIFLVVAAAVAVAKTKPAPDPAPTPVAFTVDDKANAQLAKKMNIPVYFAVPRTAYVDLPPLNKTSDKLVDFKHPDGKSAQGDVGLRLVVASRSGLAKRLAQSGLVQTGDLLLSFRTEWGGAGAYPNIQMGISHTGLAYVKDGYVHNIDNPLSNEYLGPRSDLTSEHYSTLDYIHVIRPRGLTDQEKANLVAWASLLASKSGKVYPSQLSFNQDYQAPKYKPGQPLDFVKRLGQIALGQNPPGGPLDLYCSEFAFSLLSLRDCDPAKTADEFKSGWGVPACIKMPMKPMTATGNVVPGFSRSSYSGLADGPLLVIASMKLPDDTRNKLLHSIFIENPAGLSKMSVGHRDLAKAMQPKFEPLERYYIGITGKLWQSWRAKLLGVGFNWAGIPENYSPTSYLINTLLPKNDRYRTMDYVATIVMQ